MGLSDIGFERLVAAIVDAPLVPEWAVGRVADAGSGDPGQPPFTALRWDKDKPRKPVAGLTPKQLEAVQALAHGENPTTIAPDDRRNLYASLRGAGARLGAVTTYQTVAVAVGLGIVNVKQHYVVGPTFRLSGDVARRDRPERMLPESLRVVLVGVCNGLTNEEIAAASGITTETVKTYVKRLLERYGAKNRTHLAALAVRHHHVY